MNARATALSAEPVSVELTVPEIRSIAIAALDREGSRVMKTIHEIEYADTTELAHRSIVGTVLEPIVTALRARGLNVEYTFGSIRQALDYHPIEMHLAFCNCENGTEMQCADAACNLETIEEVSTKRMIALSIRANPNAATFGTGRS